MGSYRNGYTGADLKSDVPVQSGLGVRILYSPPPPRANVGGKMDARLATYCYYAARALTRERSRTPM